MSIEGPAFLHLKSFSSFMHNCVPYITSNFPMDRRDRFYQEYTPQKRFMVSLNGGLHPAKVCTEWKRKDMCTYLWKTGDNDSPKTNFHLYISFLVSPSCGNSHLLFGWLFFSFFFLERTLCIKWQMDISIRNPCPGHFIRLSIKLCFSLWSPLFHMHDRLR